MKLLPLGSVVILKKGTQKLTVISRMPLYNNDSTIGYFDYAACLYPNGVDGKETIFFNNQDIGEIIFEGYVDEQEEQYRKKVIAEEKNIKYPKLQIIN